MDGIPFFRLPAVIVLFVCAGARADLFSLGVQTTSGTPQQISVSGHDLTNLVSDLVQSRNEFSGFQNRDLSATLNYAGINNAATITRNAAGTSATLSIPSIGLNRTFTGYDTDDLKHHIIDYIRLEGATEYGKFLRVVNGSTYVGVTDGNPLATTAMLADHQYEAFGLNLTPFPAGEDTGDLDAVSAPRLRFDISSGYSEADNGNGYFVRANFDCAFRFTDRIALVLSTPFLYRDVEGAAVYEGGEEAALPIAIIPTLGDGSPSWTVTPSAMVGAGGSIDLAAGGTFAGTGVTSSLNYQIGGFTFTLADHYSYYRGYPLRVGDYHFDTDLEQQVLKNGVKIAKSFGSVFFIDGEATYTDFLERAAVRNYLTPGVGFGLRFGPNMGLRFGYDVDLGSHITDHEGNVQFYFNW